MASISFLGDLLGTITERGRDLIGLGRADAEAVARAGSAELVRLCSDLISRRGEASGVALARLILDRYAALPRADRAAFLARVADAFGSDEARIERAIAAYRETPSRAALGELHRAAEPKSQELIRRLNLAPGGTLSLVRMRETVLDLTAGPGDGEAGPSEALRGLDGDFAHLFSSWFNRGFLVLRRIDWTTSAHILEKIIRYEAVHTIRGWDDLRRRIEPPDRRCFAYFHPALLDEPLIFVEVALTRDIPAAIAPILAEEREPIPPGQATTATFYSISNCQRGLSGVSFGNFLIKQVVEDLARELPALKTFVTLSPVPGFARWLDGERQSDEPAGLTPEDQDVLNAIDEPGWHEDPAKAAALRKALIPAAAYYFMKAKSASGRALDPVARFHLGNGARLERLNHLGDLSPKGLSQSRGLMVNYLYDLASIERNHEAYANQGVVMASGPVQKALKDLPDRALAPA